MNITKETKEDLTGVLRVNIIKEDYEQSVQKLLTDYQKKARIDGFRPGKVPFGMIKKMYGKSVLLDELNKLIKNNLSEYIQNNEIHMLGELLPLEDESKLDLENGNNFEFAFEFGIQPDITVDLNTKDKYVYYEIKPDESLIQSYIDRYSHMFGNHEVADTIVNGDERIKGFFVELNENGEVKADGIEPEESTIYLEFIKDEDIKAKMIKLKVGDKLSFNLRKAYPNNTELASILHLKKEEAEKIESEFQFTITEIAPFVNAPLNQELFDKVYGEGAIASEEEFKARIIEEIGNSQKTNSMLRFGVDAKNKLLSSVNIPLPVSFLKKWLYQSSDGKASMETIENEFERFEESLKWDMVVNQITKDNQIDVTEEEIKSSYMNQLLSQFQQYGMFNISEDVLNQYVEAGLQKDEERRRIVHRIFESKAVELIYKTVKQDVKKVTLEEFNQLYEEPAKQVAKD